jgi:hypothetical protein
MHFAMTTADKLYFRTETTISSETKLQDVPTTTHPALPISETNIIWIICAPKLQSNSKHNLLGS